MGNVLLRGGTDRPRRIKIMKANGTVMKLRIPASVKEILIDYPNHGIFEAPAGHRLGISSFTEPLSERVELVAGHLYYLIPLSPPQVYDNSSNKSLAKDSSGSVPSASCRLQPPSYAGSATGSIKQQKEVDTVVNKINTGGVRVVSSSYSTDGSTLRVKLRLRKEDLASFLSANDLLMENVVVPTIFQRTTRQSALSPWKPSLDTIAEPHQPACRFIKI